MQQQENYINNINEKSVVSLYNRRETERICAADDGADVAAAPPMYVVCEKTMYIFLNGTWSRNTTSHYMPPHTFRMSGSKA